MTNAPKWSRDLTKLMNPKVENDWRLLSTRLGYSNEDIRGWAQQNDPCMAMLSEWYATHKTSEANHAVLTALQEMNRLDGAAIVENAMKAFGKTRYGKFIKQITQNVRNMYLQLYLKCIYYYLTCIYL